MDSFRFKVVKIISKEPFKRGRWLCMDFTHPPSNGTANIEACLSTSRPIDITSSAGQGVSAVAIDNKIEQAMDLVKSHLMFAVREEMDVLKEKINELMEKISNLEMENSILKAHASQETLALIEQQQHLQQYQQVHQQPQQQQSQQQQSQATQPQQTIQQQTQSNQTSAPTLSGGTTANSAPTISTSNSATVNVSSLTTGPQSHPMQHSAPSTNLPISQNQSIQAPPISLEAPIQ